MENKDLNFVLNEKMLSEPALEEKNTETISKQLVQLKVRQDNEEQEFSREKLKEEIKKSNPPPKYHMPAFTNALKEAIKREAQENGKL